MTGLVLAAALSMMGPGMGAGPGIGMLMNPMVQQELGLSQDQVEKLQKVFDDMQMQTIDIKADIAKLTLQMKQMMRSENPDEKAVDQLIQQISDKRAEMQTARVKAMLQVRKILSKEQFEKFQAMKPPFKAKGGKHGKGRGPR